MFYSYVVIANKSECLTRFLVADNFPSCLPLQQYSYIGHVRWFSAKKKEAKQQVVDVWEGRVGGCAMDEES